MRETKKQLIERYEAQIQHLKIEMNGTAERARAIIDSKEALHKKLKDTEESLKEANTRCEIERQAKLELVSGIAKLQADLVRKEDFSKEQVEVSRVLRERVHVLESGNRDLQNEITELKNLQRMTTRALHGLEGTKRDNFGEIALLESENRRLVELINSKNRALKLIRGLCGEENADSVQDIVTPYPNNFPG